MKYAKLNAGVLEYAPRTITVGQTHYNPTPSSWLEDNGYLPVVETPYPQDGKYYIGSWTEQDGQIFRVWTETEGPEPEPTAEERLSDIEEAIQRGLSL